MNIVFAFTLAATLFVTMLFCAWRVWRYRHWFVLPARRDDVLNVTPGHLEVQLGLTSRGFAISGETALRRRTVLLRLTVSGPLWNRFFDPYIESRCGARTSRQYFERGAHGQRYLDLSALFAGNDTSTQVDMRGHLLRWRAAAACLLVFEPPVTADTTALVVAPHPDDAEIAAFGLYAARPSWVCTITAGERSRVKLPAAVPASMQAHWAAALRVWDSLAVPQLGGVAAERCVNLVWPDGTLALMHDNPSQSFILGCESTLPRSQLRARNPMAQFQTGGASCDWPALTSELRQLILATRPGVVVCPHPLLDTHSDHVFTAVAVEQALRDLPTTPPTVLLYVVHTRGAALHPFGPAHAQIGPPPQRGDDCVASSIYSYALDARMRLTKHLAIDAMHGAHARGGEPASLPRRFARPNELYFVTSVDQLRELALRAIEAQRRSQPAGAADHSRATGQRAEPA